MIDCSPSALAAAASCYCLPQDRQRAAWVYLLCNIFDAIAVNTNYGFISGYGAGPFISVLSINVYYPVTNYVASLVSGTVVANKAAGTLTVGTAGNYRVSFSVSSTGGSNDQIESDVSVNGVPSDVIAGHGSSSNNVNARDDCVAGQGILALNAGDVVSVRSKNINSTTLTISHVQLSVGTP